MTSSLNKKNLKLKNITFMSPTTQTKLNMTNLLSDPNKVKKGNNNNSKLQLNNNYNSNISNLKNNNLITDLLRSNSSNRNFNYSKKAKRNNYKINKKNNIIKKSTSNSPTLTFSQFSSNLNSANGSKKNIGIYSSPKNYLMKNLNIKNYRNKRNFFKENDYFSGNNSTSNILKNTINFKTNTFKTEYNHKNNKSNFSMSNENFNEPFSFSSMNNIKVCYNQLYKRVNQKNPSNINIISFQNEKKNNKANSISSQIGSTQSSINKKITKSINSNLSNDNEIYNIKNIDTPEELHFFYVNILLNGKEVEGKFEVSSSINN